MEKSLSQRFETGKEYRIIGYPKPFAKEVYAEYIGERNGKNFFRYDDKEKGIMIVTTPAQFSLIDGDVVRIMPHSSYSTGLASLKDIKDNPNASGLLKVLKEFGVE